MNKVYQEALPGRGEGGDPGLTTKGDNPWHMEADATKITINRPEFMVEPVHISVEEFSRAF